MNFKTNFPAAILAIVATFGSFAAISPARAQMRAVITIADLDLATRAGRNRLDHRIARVSDKLCRTANPVLDIRIRRALSACRAQISSVARAQIAERTRVAVR